MRAVSALALLIACALAGGCAHEAFQGGVLRKDGVSVDLGPVPSGWRRVSMDGADLAFRDDQRDASALVDVRCAERGQDAPLSILTENLVIGTTQRDFEKQEVVPFDGREAMHSVLRAKLDGVPMQYDIYVMKKDGCVYDLVYVAAPESFAGGAPAFERFVAGLHARSSSIAESPPPARDP